jgi:hypothetical protein
LTSENANLDKLKFGGVDMIEKNGIRAFSDDNYDYYELLVKFGKLEKGAIFVHDPDDNMYGSLSRGCLKLCWTPDGNCYSGLCANTVFLHYAFVEDASAFDKSVFKLVQSAEKNLKEEIAEQIKNLENALLDLKTKFIKL